MVIKVTLRIIVTLKTILIVGTIVTVMDSMADVAKVTIMKIRISREQSL